MVVYYKLFVIPNFKHIFVSLDSVSSTVDIERILKEFFNMSAKSFIRIRTQVSASILNQLACLGNLRSVTTKADALDSFVTKSDFTIVLFTIM